MTYAPGDFIVTHGSGLFDRAIQLMTRSRWNHAALVVDETGAMVEAVGSGVKPAPAGKYDAVDHYHVSVALSDEDQREVQAYAAAMVARHSRYGYLTIATIALRLLTGLRLVIKLDGTMICSEFVARALGQGGHLWDGDPALMSPAELVRQAERHPAMQVTKHEGAIRGTTESLPPRS